MGGWVEVADAEIAEAVGATEGEMLELLVRLVEAPTVLGNEESGQVLMAEASCAIAGLEPGDIPMDEQLLPAHPRAAPFDWDVRGKRNVVADRLAAGSGGRSLVLNTHVDVGGPASDAFLQPPLFSSACESGMSTLYTAVYAPARGAVEYRWPSLTWEQSFERFREESRMVRLVETTAA